jgi:phosphomannomutase
MQKELTQAPPTTHHFDPAIFRENDIRGIVGKNLSAEDAYIIGRAFASRTAVTRPGGTICVGRDGRLTSPELHEAVCQGITDTGLIAIDVGLGPTPMLYFAAHTLRASAAIMITGSHNPAEHNGFKFMLGGKSFFGEAIQALRATAEAGRFMNKRGRRDAHDVMSAYTDTLLRTYRAPNPLRVAWDAGNGATGQIMSALCCRLPGEHTMLNTAIDGRFPAHHPDPTVPENLEQLIETVKKDKLDVGIAFDGDGDRIGVVDDEGEILWGDQLLMLYAAEILKEKPGSIIIADVKASSALFEEIERLGGKPLMWKTGHSLIKSKMVETAAPLAGEMSGHIFFADKYFGYDDALYAAVRLLSLLSRSGKKLSELRNELPRRVNTPEIRFACDDNRKFAVIDEVKARLREAGAEFNDVDGIRINTEDGWWLLRASNTQAVLVARCEAENLTGLKRLKDDLRHQLSLSNVALPVT